MKALICIRPGEFRYITKDLPEKSANNTIIKIRKIGICGTDYHAFEGNQPFFEYPRILGHEIAAELLDDVEGTAFKKGEAITTIPYFNCSECIACRSGKSNCCVKLSVCGVHIDGGMVESLSVPTSSLVHGAGLSYDELALIEPFAIGAHGIGRAEVKKDEFVLVIGAGPIGLTAMKFARIAGAKVIAMDTIASRLNFCKEVAKVDYTVNALDSNALTQLQHITNGDMPQVVIDATGNRTAINNAFQYISHGGRYVLIGLQKEEISFSHPEFHKREATLMSSRNATRRDFEFVIDCIKNKLISPLNYITHRVDFDNVGDQFKQLINDKSEVIKAIIDM